METAAGTRLTSHVTRSLGSFITSITRAVHGTDGKEWSEGCEGGDVEGTEWQEERNTGVTIYKGTNNIITLLYY